MDLFLLQLLNGLVSGAFYALLALGLALILSLTRIINLAHGGFLVVGAYLGYVLAGLLGLLIGEVLQHSLDRLCQLGQQLGQFRVGGSVETVANGLCDHVLIP